MYTAAGETLADYAAKNSDTVLYMNFTAMYTRRPWRHPIICGRWKTYRSCRTAISAIILQMEPEPIRMLFPGAMRMQMLWGCRRRPGPCTCTAAAKAGDLQRTAIFPKPARATGSRNIFQPIRCCLRMRRYIIGLQPGYPVEDDYRSRAETFDNLIPRKNLFWHWQLREL